MKATVFIIGSLIYSASAWTIYFGSTEGHHLSARGKMNSGCVSLNWEGRPRKVTQIKSVLDYSRIIHNSNLNSFNPVTDFFPDASMLFVFSDYACRGTQTEISSGEHKYSKPIGSYSVA